MGLAASSPGVRIFRDGNDPLAFRIGRRNRFDPLATPWENTKVLYAGETIEVAVAETILRWHRQIVPGESVSIPESDLQTRRVARFACSRPLTLVDCSGLGMANVEAVVTEVVALPENADFAKPPTPVAEDIFQCDEAEYAVTQQWGAWFRTQCPNADGITWTSRQYNRSRCVVLFHDRCEHELAAVGSSVPLYAKGSSERAVLEQMIGRLGWGVEGS